jgi:hypothetical protein
MIIHSARTIDRSREFFQHVTPETLAVKLDPKRTPSKERVVYLSHLRVLAESGVEPWVGEAAKHGLPGFTEGR